MKLQVEVENTGTSTWLAGDGLQYGFIQLGAHLLAGTGELLELGFLRAPPAARPCCRRAGHPGGGGAAARKAGGLRP